MAGGEYWVGSAKDETEVSAEGLADELGLGVVTQNVKDAFAAHKYFEVVL